MTSTPKEAQDSDQASSAHTTTDKTYSFECFPAERVILLFGAFAGPGIVMMFLWQIQQGASMTDLSLGEFLSTNTKTTLYGTFTVLSGLGALLFSLTYLRFRSRTKLVLSQTGFLFERNGVLFGLFDRSVCSAWSEVSSIDVTIGRGLFKKPVLRIHWVGGDLTISVADSWDADQGEKRPLVAKKPRGGWKNHALVKEMHSRMAHVRLQQ